VGGKTLEIFNLKHYEAGDMAETAEGLPSKGKALSSNLNTARKISLKLLHILERNDMFL
jgi:hypothetical protein